MNTTLIIILIIICVLISGYFVSLLTSLTELNITNVKTLAEKGNKKAELVSKIDDAIENYHVTITTGKYIANIIAIILAIVFYNKLIVAKPILNFVLAGITMLFVLSLFTEIIPSMFARKSPENTAMRLVKGLVIAHVVLFPINVIYLGIKKVIAKIFKLKEEQTVTEDELISLVKEAEEDGTLNEGESELITSAIEFTDSEVGDILTPRFDVVAISEDLPINEIRKVFVESGYSRIPVYQKEFDNMIGILYYKDFFDKIPKTKEDILKLLKPILFVTKSQNVKELLQEFQAKQIHLGVVVDEFGVVSGIVTLEDIIEELVGEIWDERDEVIEEIQKVSDEEYIVYGKTNLDDLFETLEIEEEIETPTVSGWVMNIAKCIPTQGMVFKHQGFEIKILKMNGKRIDKVLISDKRYQEKEKSNQ